MIKVVAFNNTKNLNIIGKYFKSKGIEYFFEQVNKSLYVENYLKEDIKSFDLILLTTDIKEIKRDIRNIFGLKNEINKFLQENPKYYYRDNSMIGTNFDDFTLPTGFLPISSIKENFSFWGQVNDKCLFCLDDDSAEIDLALPLFNSKFAIENLIKTSCLKMLFLDNLHKSNVEDCLKELNCNGFRWAIFDEEGGVLSVYLYFMTDISNFAMANIERTLFSVFSENIYANFDATPAEVLVHMASIANIKIATAESLTGGLVADSIVSVPGASKVFDCGIVSYSNQIKEALLQVQSSNLQEYGAVSEQVAKEMALGLFKFGCDIGVSTTGIAGPTGETANKPIGLVYIGVATKNNVELYKYLFDGDREQIRQLSANIAIFNTIKMINKM